MRVTVTGASGLIGRRLSARLEQAGHIVHALGRRPKAGIGSEFSVWDPDKSIPPMAAIEGADAVIHLAGEPVAQRWSADVKRRIRSSRVDGTRHLVEAIRQAVRKPSVLVSASAVGYYGDRGAETLEEPSGPGNGFLPEVCVEWEREALTARSLGVRVALTRIGLVLAAEGGALEKMLPAFKMGVGGRMGSGEQYMSWIHVDDLVSLLVWAVEDRAARGPYNATAPNPVNNADFTVALARALRRPAILPVPAFAAKLLFGEMAEILFHSQRAIPRAALQQGFVFRHPEVFGALSAVLT